eukprot:2036243-Amphidinium_carterae.2
MEIDQINGFKEKNGKKGKGKRKHFNKVGIAETGIDEVSIQHLKEKLKIGAVSSSTSELDVRTPKSRGKMTDDSLGVSCQETQTCCKCDATQFLRQCQFEGCQKKACMSHREWIARDAVSKKWHSSASLNAKCQVAITECVELPHIGVHWMGESGAISVQHQVIMDHASGYEVAHQ